VSNKKDRRESGDYQRAVSEFVGREVVYCVSGLVFEIASKKEEWFHLFAQEDWETPACDAIRQLSRSQLEEFLARFGSVIEAGNSDEALAAMYLQRLKDEDALRDFCEENKRDALQSEIYEHWIVSDWLAGRLEERGEVVQRDFYGLTVWGRACTGQAILLDSVICAIYDEFHREG